MPITELRIEGLRTIEKIRLPLDGLTVLIGENGSGKSSILEACEILRRATGPRFMDELYSIHGGLSGLLRQGAKRLLLGVTLQLDEAERSHDLDLEYDLILVSDGAFATIEEHVRAKVKDVTAPAKIAAGKKKARRAREWITVAQRRADRLYFLGEREWIELDKDLPFLAKMTESWLVSGEDGEEGAWYIAQHLKRMRVHIPFEMTPAWAARALDRKSALRSPSLLTPATHLEKLGLNLASAYHALKNNFGPAHWHDTLTYIRLGLGERIEDVVTWADPGGGHIGLSVRLAGLDRPILSSQISDGMLSDALLDGLKDPAKSVVLCELDERGATRLVRPDAEALARWLERYRGLGDIQSAGHAASVLTKVERP
jgi:predicted ATPase